VNIYAKKQRWKLWLAGIAVVIIGASLWYTNVLVKTVSEEERKKVVDETIPTITEKSSKDALQSIIKKILSLKDLTANTSKMTKPHLYKYFVHLKNQM
jgi:apolipoprotein N-acyltransferase